MGSIGTLRVNMYADDCLIYNVGNNWEDMIPRIQTGLDGFQNWCKDNCLKLNVRKTNSFVIGTHHKLSAINAAGRFTLDDSPLDHVNIYNYLGIVLDSQMSLTPLFS